MKTISHSHLLSHISHLSPFLSPPLSLSRVEAIYPVPIPHNMHDSRVATASVFQYAVKVEKMFFENASSKVSPESWAWSL